MKSRRSFIQNASFIGAGLGLAPNLVFAATDKKSSVNIGLIGVGLRGTNHLNNLLSRDDVLVMAICDIDQIRIELEKWNIPSLVIFPDGDMAWKPDEGKEIANILLDSEFHLIKNTGHYIQEDAGEEVAELIVNFLNRNKK